MPAFPASGITHGHPSCLLYSTPDASERLREEYVPRVIAECDYPTPGATAEVVCTVYRVSGPSSRCLDQGTELYGSFGILPAVAGTIELLVGTAV